MATMPQKPKIVVEVEGVEYAFSDYETAAALLPGIHAQARRPKNTLEKDAFPRPQRDGSEHLISEYLTTLPAKTRQAVAAVALFDDSPTAKDVAAKIEEFTGKKTTFYSIGKRMRAANDLALRILGREIVRNVGSPGASKYQLDDIVRLVVRTLPHSQTWS